MDEAQNPPVSVAPAPEAASGPQKRFPNRFLLWGGLGVIVIVLIGAGIWLWSKPGNRLTNNSPLIPADLPMPPQAKILEDQLAVAGGSLQGTRKFTTEVDWLTASQAYRAFFEQQGWRITRTGSAGSFRADGPTTGTSVKFIPSTINQATYIEMTFEELAE